MSPFPERAAVSLPNNSTESVPVRKLSDPYRVMVVDDSAVIRGFLTRYLEEDGAIKVVASAANGEQALRNLAASRAEVVLLDIEMPVMDGMTVLPRLIEAVPDIKIVMASTLTLKNADISMRALRLGAVDYVPKPESTRDVNTSIDFRREIVGKAKAYAAARRRARGEPEPGAGARAPSWTVVSRRGADSRPAPQIAARGTSRDVASRPIALRQPSPRPAEVLAIGSSTGGPQALMTLMAAIADSVAKVPVLVVQHMPATFTAILADHVGRASGLPAAEATDGARLEPGHVYIAPGDWHMRVVRESGAARIALDREPQENFCRPSVDPMFRSVAKAYGDRALALVLTGMGQDGLQGARDLVGAGGTLIAQDEATSIVWGMPGAVATAGLCSAVVPLHDMKRAVEKSLGGRR